MHTPFPVADTGDLLFGMTAASQAVAVMAHIPGGQVLDGALDGAFVSW